MSNPKNAENTKNKDQAVGASDFVTEAYNLEDEASMKQFYTRWAEDYDNQMLNELSYVSHRKIAAAMAAHLGDTGARILDIGCGTGLTVVGLAEAGYSSLYGIDLSEDMVEVSRSRGIYQSLKTGDVNQPLEYEDGYFGGVISSGTFTHGHVGPEPLVEICRILRPGGILACTVHMDLWKSMSFERAFTDLESTNVLECLSLEKDSYYENTEPEGWFCVYRKR